MRMPQPPAPSSVAGQQRTGTSPRNFQFQKARALSVLRPKICTAQPLPSAAGRGKRLCLPRVQTLPRASRNLS